MTSVTNFLLARIAEDEAVAREITDAPDADYLAIWTLPASATVDVGDDDLMVGDQRLARHMVRWDPARVLAECEARRRIVDLAYLADEEGAQPIYDRALRSLALPYADHPDYREEWRP